jgi:hypothetical protein
MASQSAISSTPRAAEASRQQEYYPLWRHVTKVKAMGAGGGSWEWKCNLCKKDRTFKGSYTRVKAHILHEGKGIEGCPHILDLQVRDKFHKEHDDAQKVKDNRAKIAMHGNSKHPPSLGVSNEPMIVHEARKRRALEVENEISKGPGGRGATLDSRLMNMFNNQKREETESRVARAIFACGIPFNVVRSPYWKGIVKAINEAPQGFKGPNYEKFRTVAAKREVIDS